MPECGLEFLHAQVVLTKRWDTFTDQPDVSLPLATTLLDSFPTQPRRRQMHVLNTMRRGIVVPLLAAGLAACSEGTTAPRGPTFDAPAALFVKGGKSGGGGGSGSGSGAPGKSEGSRTFTIWPGAAVSEKFGEHTLYIPANVTCDPATAGYGATSWDQPCARAKQPIQVTATWSTLNGSPAITFSQALRFAPSSHERDWVSLSLKDTKGIDPDRYYTILWYDEEAGHWVDESVTDPTLKARTNQSGNLVTRRLKHFSLYRIWSGRSGYNVTSG
jgi:hypothetical protein